MALILGQSAAGLIWFALPRFRAGEFGVRLALGATTSDVSRMVLRRGVVLAAVGVALGLLGALAANRLLSALLFEVNPTDALTLGVIALVVLAVAALASVLPARASTRIAPAISLRAE